METAYERAQRYDSSLTHAIEEAVLPVATALGSHWAHHDRYQDWYLLRDQFRLNAWKVSQLSVISLAARISAAVLADSPQLHEQIRAQATHSPYWAARQAAIQALATGWRDDPATLPLLHDRATTDENRTVRQAAIQALTAGWGDDS